MLRHQSVKNRGLKVSVGKRIKIPFRFPKKQETKINIVYNSKSSKPEDKSKDKPSSNSYTYSIELGGE